MTQLCIEDWTATTTPLHHHARPRAQNRYTCKCRLCGKRWTANAAERDASFSRHGETCTKYQAILKRWGNDASARWNLANSYMDRREIIGTFKAGIRCDARCQGAVGHTCECSCGGANHGIGVSL